MLHVELPPLPDEPDDEDGPDDDEEEEADDALDDEDEEDDAAGVEAAGAVELDAVLDEPLSLELLESLFLVEP